MLKAMILGFILGGFLGFVIPYAWWFFYEMANPAQGVGTVFAMIMFFSIPVGMGLGTIIGAIIGANQ